MGWVIKNIVRWAGCEIDSLEASRKLQKEGIKEVILQASNKDVAEDQIPHEDDFETDEVIPAQASLGFHLVKNGLTDNKVFSCEPYANHNEDFFSDAIEKEIRAL
jgi:hypothetical protein